MGHYSNGQQPSLLTPWSTKNAEWLHEKMQSYRKPTHFLFMYSGFSGIALATAIANDYYHLTDREVLQMYVRKPKEISHGERIEFNGYSGMREIIRYKETVQPIFIDDFMESGQTYNYVIKRVGEYLYKEFGNSEILLRDVQYLRQTQIGFVEDWYNNGRVSKLSKKIEIKHGE